MERFFTVLIVLILASIGLGITAGIYGDLVLGFGVTILMVSCFLATTASFQLKTGDESLEIQRLPKALITIVYLGVVIGGLWHFLLLIGHFIAPGIIGIEQASIYRLDSVAAFIGCIVAYIEARLSEKTPEDGIRIF